MVFALRMVIFLYRGVPTILFMWLLRAFSRSTRQTTAPGVYMSSSTPGLIGRRSRIMRSSSSFHTTLTEPRWANTTVLSGDVAAAVRELKAKPGRELQVQGSGALIRWLLDNQLVDEITLFTFPVVIGQGTRLFPDTGPDIALDLVDSRATPKGVTIQAYRPAGRPGYQ